MKKFISMAMVAAMTTSMVPATAFAAGEVSAEARILETLELTKAEAKADQDIADHTNEVPELRLKITDAVYKNQNADESGAAKAKVNLTLDGAEWRDVDGSLLTPAELEALIEVVYDKTGVPGSTTVWNPSASTPTTLYNATTKQKVTMDSLSNLAGKDAINFLLKDEIGGKFTWTGTAGTLVYVEAADLVYNTSTNTADGFDAAKVIEEVELATTKASSIDVKDVSDLVEYAQKAYDKMMDSDATNGAYLFVKTVDANGDDVYTALSLAERNAFKVVSKTGAVYLDSWNFFTDATDLTKAEVISAYEDAGYVQGAFEAPAATTNERNVTWSVERIDEEEIEITFYGQFVEDDMVYIDLFSRLTKTNEGHKATVSVDGDLVVIDDMVYASIMGEGLSIEVKKTVDVAEEEVATLKDVKIKAVVGDLPSDDKDDEDLKLTLSKGFEFTNACKTLSGTGWSVKRVDDNKLYIDVKAGYDEIKVVGLEVEATTAKSGDVATIKVTADDFESAAAEVAKVVDYKVVMSVEEDEDVPVFYSGVDANNTGLTVDDEHESLEVTLSETFAGAWSMHKDFTLELPDGVYVTNVDVVDENGTFPSLDVAFFDAYQEGEHKAFEFKKRTFTETNPDIPGAKEHEMTFTLELVADPTFVGDVTLKLTGDAVDEQEVTIAKFVPFAVVEAEQNDLKIDYRYTEIPSTITVTEAEAGLWEKGSEFWVALDKGNYIEFEDDAVFETTGELEIDDFTGKTRTNKDGDTVVALGFEVDEESDEAATVTISGMSLFMQRNIPAGAYDLTAGTTATAAYLGQQLYAPDCDTAAVGVGAGECTCTTADKDNDCYIYDVEDFSDVVKEAFVNIVTAGREQDDASFTTKVVVPVGESYIVSGEKTVELDVPAYVSEAGYTMLPVRAVATALGINSNNVLWNGESKTVTILYGQRIITMVAGQKVVNVNGSAIPASAAVEITEGRTFLPMRDLATALGVTDITWDAATKTATLNGGVVAE